MYCIQVMLLRIMFNKLSQKKGKVVAVKSLLPFSGCFLCWACDSSLKWVGNHISVSSLCFMTHCSTTSIKENFFHYIHSAFPEVCLWWISTLRCVRLYTFVSTQISRSRPPFLSHSCSHTNKLSEPHFSCLTESSDTKINLWNWQGANTCITGWFDGLSRKEKRK